MSQQRSDDDDDDDDAMWEFFPSTIADTTTSIWINLGYRKGAHPAAYDTCYVVSIVMDDPAANGMGTDAEATRLWVLEDRLVERSGHLEIEFVARTRGGGKWEIVIYGAAGREKDIVAILESVDHGRGEALTTSFRDPGWSRYRELLPDDERWQWIQDRRTVEILEEHGDIHSIPRRVDHWAYFRSETKRRSFINMAENIGFRNDETGIPESRSGNSEFPARVFRTETTELESIHATVMQLWHVARSQDGYYDGWETSVEAEN